MENIKVRQCWPRPDKWHNGTSWYEYRFFMLYKRTGHQSEHWGEFPYLEAFKEAIDSWNENSIEFIYSIEPFTDMVMHRLTG